MLNIDCTGPFTFWVLLPADHGIVELAGMGLLAFPKPSDMQGSFEAHRARNGIMSHCAQRMLVAARRAIAVLSVLSLLVASLAHICGHQESPAESAAYLTVVSADASGGTDIPDGNSLPGHHCGACTGIVLPQPAPVDVAVAVAAGAIVARPVFPHAHRPALHTPPPKSLT